MTSTSHFQYEAVSKAGSGKTGTIAAINRQQAISELARDGLFVTTIEEVDHDGQGTNVSTSETSKDFDFRSLLPTNGKIKSKQMMMVWRQLSTGVDAGLPLLGTLQAVSRQAEKAAIKELLEDLAKHVQDGDSLSDAMRTHPDVFSSMQISMVDAGETAGVLDEILASIADFCERDNDIRESVKSAMTYPAIVLSLAVVSVMVIVTFILPNILGQFEEDGVPLPLPTRMLLFISDVVYYGWWLFGIIGVVGWMQFKKWINTETGRYRFDSILLKLPIVGGTLRKIAVGRFSRALGTMAKSGIQILEALGVLRDSLGNEKLGRHVDEVKDAITQGQSIAKPLEETGQFPPMFIQVVSIGEKSGKLDEMLLHAANAFDKETKAAIERMTTLLPAIMIVLLALLVVFILAAILLPIMDMSSAIAGM